MDSEKISEKLANDYSQYLKLDIAKELSPMCQAIEDMLIRLDEFEVLMNVMENQNKNPLKLASKVLQCKHELDTLHARINYLHIFINKVNDDMTLLEKQVEAAEEQFGAPEARIKGFLKPFLAKISKEQPSSTSQTQPGKEYTRPSLFKTADYFPQDIIP